MSSTPGAGPANARLTALRLVGFKSFADKTVVEFGAGISAIVGPNGSGKSNLADALRWTLGEQGRSLRTRRSEDVIFAGSSGRRAIGMADVTLVIDNGDRLLPVDYGEVEIGRRLYRSGENEYLLNRQRIRLRDLVELLDAGNLADNAFLFIGQGMVDQALALRPEERRPLFEEAAGIRRHERRRRQAEAELVEAEANLDRLRDLLGELRPQARRLAAQADQLEARRSAGIELAEAVLAVARWRWSQAALTARTEQHALERDRAAADAALAGLRTAEAAAVEITTQLASHAEHERTLRTAFEQYRGVAVEHRVALARVDSDLAATARDSARIGNERTTAESRLAEARRKLSAASPGVDYSFVAELESVERQLADAQLPSGRRGELRPAAAASALSQRRGELERLAARTRDLGAGLARARQRISELEGRFTAAETERGTALARFTMARDAEAAAESVVGEALSMSASSTAALAQADERRVDAEGALIAARGRLQALEAAAAPADESLARAARARGAKLVAEGAEVEPRFRRTVAAALRTASTAYVVDDAAPLAAPGRHGTLVVRAGRAQIIGNLGAQSTVIAAARAAGGGSLVDALKRDAQGELTRLLARAVWAPDLNTALTLIPALKPGWYVATLAGEVVTDEGVVELSVDRATFDVRAQIDEVRHEIGALERAAEGARAATERQRSAADAAAAAARSAQSDLSNARAEHRARAEDERVAQRKAEQLLGELNWEQAQLDRLAHEDAAAQSHAQHVLAEIRALEARAVQTLEAGPAREEELRLARLRARRDELASQKAAADVRRATIEQERQSAETQRAVDEARLEDLDTQARRIAAEEAVLAAQREMIAAELIDAGLRESTAATALEQALDVGTVDRTILVKAERTAADARERLRALESATRRAEVASMEARLQLEQIREQLLVELAAIGSDGLAAAAAGLGEELPAESAPTDVAADALEWVIDRLVASWAGAPTSESAPSAARLGILRRRFHELGAGNPFAAEEFAELSTRLTDLEAQRADLEKAISSTRELIGSLNALINEQFRSTFAALEGAFARRFTELFGGGEAQLSLTEPNDLSVTGVEIHARPPGKKRQPLSMLSGGERALTAVSLLLAMLEVRPVPFCVLDEVDAALDEANVVRFSSALRGLSQQTQFIVITHNRGTIEAADALYGVTLGDDAVSRIVSLRLPKPDSNGHGEPEMVAEAALA